MLPRDIHAQNDNIYIPREHQNEKNAHATHNQFDM